MYLLEIIENEKLLKSEIKPVESRGQDLHQYHLQDLKADSKVSSEFLKPLCDKEQNLFASRMYNFINVFFRGERSEYERVFKALSSIEFQTTALNLNDAHSKVLLGICYELGLGTEQDLNKSKMIYHDAMKSQKHVLFFFAGLCYQIGFSTTRHSRKALNLLEKSSELGSAYATLQLGNTYENATGVRKNRKKALKYYQYAANQGQSRGFVRYVIAQIESKDIPFNSKIVLSSMKTLAEYQDTTAMVICFQAHYIKRTDAKSDNKENKYHYLQKALTLLDADAYAVASFPKYLKSGFIKNEAERLQNERRSISLGSTLSVVSYIDSFLKGSANSISELVKPRDALLKHESHGRRDIIFRLANYYELCTHFKISPELYRQSAWYSDLLCDYDAIRRVKSRSALQGKAHLYFIETMTFPFFTDTRFSFQDEEQTKSLKSLVSVLEKHYVTSLQAILKDISKITHPDALLYQALSLFLHRHRISDEFSPAEERGIEQSSAIAKINRALVQLEVSDVMDDYFSIDAVDRVMQQQKLIKFYKKYTTQDSYKHLKLLDELQFKKIIAATVHHLLILDNNFDRSNLLYVFSLALLQAPDDIWHLIDYDNLKILLSLISSVATNNVLSPFINAVPDIQDLKKLLLAFKIDTEQQRLTDHKKGEDCKVSMSLASPSKHASESSKYQKVIAVLVSLGIIADRAKMDKTLKSLTGKQLADQVKLNRFQEKLRNRQHEYESRERELKLQESKLLSRQEKYKRSVQKLKDDTRAHRRDQSELKYSIKDNKQQMTKNRKERERLIKERALIEQQQCEIKKDKQLLGEEKKDVFNQLNITWGKFVKLKIEQIFGKFQTHFRSYSLSKPQLDGVRQLLNDTIPGLMVIKEEKQRDSYLSRCIQTPLANKLRDYRLPKDWNTAFQDFVNYLRNTLIYLRRNILHCFCITDTINYYSYSIERHAEKFTCELSNFLDECPQIQSEIDADTSKDEKISPNPALNLSRIKI